MTSEKIIEKAAEILRENDARRGLAGTANAVIQNPLEYLHTGDPIINACAELIAEAMQAADKKQTGAGVMQALKRIIKSAEKLGHSDVAGVFEKTDLFCVTDGYRAVRLFDDVQSLPRAKNGIDLDRIFNAITRDANVPVVLPTVAEIKAYIAANKPESKYVPTVYNLCGDLWMNARYLLDMIQALPGCKAFRGEDWKTGVYFTAETGDGVLLAVRP